MVIVPSLEEFDKDVFGEKLSKLESFASRVQVDFNDGSFLGVVTLKPAEVADLVANYASRVNFEAHLMIQKPLDCMPSLIRGGFKKIIVEVEIEGDLRSILEKMTVEEADLGLAFGPTTNPVDLEPFFGLVGTMDVMTISPGKQGQQFIPSVLENVRVLREQGFSGEIELDGGINDQTVDSILPYRPDSLVVGSYLFSTDDPKERFDYLTELVNTGPEAGVEEGRHGS